MIALCTDDLCMARVVPYVFDGQNVQVFPINQLIVALTVPCSHFIIGLPDLNNQDWALCEIIQKFSAPIFIMVRRAITDSDIAQSRKLGITGFLMDPIVKLRGQDQTDIERIFTNLAAQLNEESDSESNIFIGSETYFNAAQHFVACAEEITQLSEREADILKLFIRYEGQIVTKDTIAQELWGGRIAMGGIPKLVSRLREKLGPAGSLISGRKQGGYIYQKQTNAL